MTKFLTGQYIMKDPSSGAISGFNMRIYGHSHSDAFRYPYEWQNASRHGGWDLAEKLIDEGKIYYVHNFHKLKCPTGHAFPYGGTWVCNTCGNSGLDEEWWKIKVMQDGNEWFCVGLGFTNLQESSNFAFGTTRDAAIEAYGILMTSMKGKS